MVIRKSTAKDMGAVFKMARKLWPTVKAADLGNKKFTYYVAEGDQPIGFVMLTARKDYVEGSTTSPVGYVEGLYVEKAFRKKNVGRLLIKAAEEWCFEKGFKELGSDVELHNKASQEFHSSVGFIKGDLIVPYIKKVRHRRRTL